MARMIRSLARAVARWLIAPEEDDMSEQHPESGERYEYPLGPGFDHSHDDGDFDAAHPDEQHEPPPAISTENPADAEPDYSTETNAGELPGRIDDIPEDRELADDGSDS